MPELLYVPLNQIRQSKVALRDCNRQGAPFLELSRSIRTQGVLNAISLRAMPGDDGKKYQLVDGLQRFTASNEIGTGVVNFVPDPEDPTKTVPQGHYTTVKDADGKDVMMGVIPAQIIDRAEADTILTQVIANAQRVETRPTEYATAIIQYLGYNPTLTVAELATRLGKSPTWLDKTLTLSKLDESLKALVDEGRICLVNAYNLVKLPLEEQKLWAERAMTESGGVFAAACEARVKEIRDKNNKGLNAAPFVWAPTAHVRSKKEVETEINTPTIGAALIREIDLTKDFKPNAQGLQNAANAGFLLGLKWALSLDPKSAEKQKADWDTKKAQEADAKARRDLEKSQKQEKEAAERLAKARADADAAKLAAKDLPAVPLTPVKEKPALNPIAQAELDAQQKRDAELAAAA